MAKKVVIDPGHGGSDSGNTGNGLVEKDFALLVSNYIKQRLDQLGIQNSITRNTDRNISEVERANIIKSMYGNDKDVIVVSNHLNKGGGNGLEVIYALRNTDKFAKKIADEVEASGKTVSKYYQLRDPSQTQYDYFPLLRETPNYETVIIEYGFVDNAKNAADLKENYKDYAEAVVKAITLYTGNKYVPGGDNYYIVKKGDSLWKIASNYNTTVDELKKINNLTNNLLSIGQVIVLPSSNQTTSYVVKKGDSLWKIANVYNTTVGEIKKINNLTSDLLSIGQVIVLPASNQTTSYVVKKGDSLWKIANVYNTTVGEIKKINNLTSDLLSVGQVLTIP